MTAASASSPGTEILPRTTITRVCGLRDAAIAKMAEAADLIARGHTIAEEAQRLAEEAYGSATFYMTDRSATEAYRRLFQAFNRDTSVEMYRRHVDARVWMNLVQVTGMSDLMDKTAKDRLYKDLCDEVPHVNEETARATFEHLAGDAKLIFQRGLARAFSELDRRFKSHDAFKLGARVILTHVFDSWGSISYASRMDDTLADIERVFAVLDGNARPDPGALARAIREDRRGGGFNPRQSITETSYFKVRCYKNGNAHLWFQRDDLVEAANLQLADYYGEVLPDAVERDVHASDLQSKTTALAKNLSFYPSPELVVTALLKDLWITEESRVLEPSAGTGAIVKALLAKGARVDAIEIHPDRVAELERIGGRLKVLSANFLQVPANPIYTHVVMNPPFYGTHWMEHVTHAFDFLAPGGKLVAVLPISSELGETKKHRAFRKWATDRNRGWGKAEFRDLPAESFLTSGTRVNTVVLTVYRARV